ncbi:hypothetical protein DL765_002511 [Monosporascus sp. GIB2]|nr:hypothetical protein DL765_002511 [Monosporascus sp. GIB2]
MASHPIYKVISFDKETAGPGRFIRLLSLDNCGYRLEVKSLAKLPEYWALSYCWGNLEDTLPLQRGGGPQVYEIRVTKNLHSALVHLSQVYHGKWFWVNAICIDQGNEVEKAQQIELMRDIYSRAEEVVIWVDLQARMDEELKARIGDLGDGRRLKSWIRETAVDMALAPPKPLGIAEMDDYVAVLRMLCHREEQCDGMEPGEGDGQEARPGLAELLVQFRWSQAKKKQDKVYGLLGLAPDIQRDLVDVTYKLSISELYTWIAFAVLEQSRDLTPLMDSPNASLGLTAGNPYHRLSDTKKGIYAATAPRGTRPVRRLLFGMAGAGVF